MKKLRVLDLFSGIGGFSLGLERTGGFETVAFCEIEAFPRKVLAKHWPGVPCYHDVRELTAERLAADGNGAIDVICGGFPCQDISAQGLRAGLAGERSGLWSEIARLAGELRPRFLIVENVADLLGLGFGDVLGDLATLGLHAEWHCIPAGYVGAPHERDRLWIVAYPPEVAGLHESYFGEAAQRLSDHSAAWWKASAWNAPDARICRVDDGVPDRVDRTECCGNAVVPQVVELIGNAILASLRHEHAPAPT
jgi:DNA (cytosine-5)-methyltransferase 1